MKRIAVTCVYTPASLQRTGIALHNRDSGNSAVHESNIRCGAGRRAGPALVRLPQFLVGPHDFNNCGIQHDALDIPGQIYWWTLRRHRDLHNDPSHPHRGYKLCRLLQKPNVEK